ncbi:MAG: geranylgeranylglycerol-phosphate geranylgeranyltransferase [Flavobacteriaceae bacterium]|nr:geranylgeranylglycerol-phosphate geranylgeranyltransferase [Flavobacteriaceae bacterium]
MKIKHFFQLIRYKNLLLLTFMMILFKYAIYHTFKFPFSINLFPFFLLIIATLLITASGNIINDIFDLEIDKINKPNKIIIGKYINKKKSLNLYYTLNTIGVFIGIYLSFIVHKIPYAFVFILTSALLFLYTKYLKKRAILGNLIISLLIAVSIILVYVFSELSNFNNLQNRIIITVFLTYAFFAFILNFIREIVKDIEDIDGDYSQDLETLPILIGKKRTQNIVFRLTAIPLLLSIYFAFVYFKSQYIMPLYILFFILLPLSYFMYKIITIKLKKEFYKLSILLKIIMFFGMLSILLINY